ncbi:MAG: UDP-N-acetylmuramoyl-L-alanine--D-glutamate ligase [Acidobacteria bacterium]|nr:UDP-N-acetylmuramoyl-L-alanine--D-glutamate ligase [Acidobacteriota bacterium]
MDLEGQPVVVVGLARSGIAAAEFLARRGARVVATDRKGAGELAPEVLKLMEHGVALELGGHRAASFTAAAAVVVSPGVPWGLPELDAARSSGVPVIAEIELAFRHLSGTVVAVTGTKGKSTTTAALGEMLAAAGRDVRVGGNIGRPLVGLVEGSDDATVFAVEVSSFQLEGIESFRPKIAVLLNLSTDHLDRHASFEEYASAKARIFENQTPDDWALVNVDDLETLRRSEGIRARRLLVRPSGPLPGGDGAFVEAGLARLRLGGRTETLFPLSAVRLPGAHLAGDLLVAAVAARLLGTPADAIARAVTAFRGLEHVLERVAEVRGVVFYDDSKATNVDAARRGLEAFDRPVLAIVGGRYKGGDFEDLREVAARRVKAVLAIGESQERVALALASVTPVIPCDSLAEAVERAFGAAEPGDAVVLAPGCSSFDMFRDYAERGRAFKEAVRRLSEEFQPGGPPARSGAHPSAEPGSTPGEAEPDDDGGARTRNG